MKRVGVRELKNKLSFYLKQVEAGTPVEITRKGERIAVIVPVEKSGEKRKLYELVRNNLASWGGGKPKGSRRAPEVRGKKISEIIIEERG